MDKHTLKQLEMKLLALIGTSGWPNPNDADFFQKIDKLAKKKSEPSITDLVGIKMQTFKVNGYKVYKFTPKDRFVSKAFFYMHGGAFRFPPGMYHWTFVTDLVKSTGQTAYFIRYPLSGDFEDTIAQVFESYRQCRQDWLKVIELDETAPRAFSAVIGDSAGATLALELAAGLPKPEQPLSYVVISPCADTHITNLDMDEMEAKDPILPLWTLRKMLDMKVKRSDPNNPQLNLICANYKNAAPMVIYTGGRDILYPDVEKLHQKLEAEGIKHTYVYNPRAVHDWVLFPFPQSDKYKAQIVKLLKSAK
jgi:acetyl esterase/lipase